MNLARLNELKEHLVLKLYLVLKFKNVCQNLDYKLNSFFKNSLLEAIVYFKESHFINLYTISVEHLLCAGTVVVTDAALDARKDEMVPFIRMCCLMAKRSVHTGITVQLDRCYDSGINKSAMGMQKTDKMLSRWVSRNDWFKNMNSICHKRRWVRIWWGERGKILCTGIEA